MQTFNKYGLKPEILKALEVLNYKVPTKIQRQAIPIIMTKKDLILKSDTGSGKTAAFAIPVLQDIDWSINQPQALVLTPTRELAIQVKDEMFNIGRFLRMKVLDVYGKSPMHAQVKALKQKTHVVCGTPGRVLDHLERGTFNVSELKYLILDEADEMFNMGFLDQVSDIIDYLPQVQVILLSATFPDGMSIIKERYMKDPDYIEVESQTAKSKILQKKIEVTKHTRLEILHELLIVNQPETAIIFCNTRDEVDKVYNQFKDMSYPIRRLHGGMKQEDRTSTMSKFKKGHFRYLVATDVAARGIDVDDIDIVFNYDMPEAGETYVHRIGRTGRKGKDGFAISLVHASLDLSIYEELVDSEIEIIRRPSEVSIEEAKFDFDVLMTTSPKLKEDHSTSFNEIMKLHINAGRKTKMRAGDIVGTLCSIDGMTADDIGNITISDISTFVEILNHKGEIVYNALQDKTIKGRIRKVSKSNK